MDDNMKEIIRNRWIKILKNIITNNKALQESLKDKCNFVLSSCLDKLKDGNDLEKEVYEQYVKNKKLSPKLQKEYSAAILSEVILATEKELGITLFNYVIRQKLDKTILNETAIAFALVACMFSFCEQTIESCGRGPAAKEKFIKVMMEAFSWHVDSYNLKKEEPSFKEFAKRLNELINVEIPLAENNVYDSVSVPPAKKEDLN